MSAGRRLRGALAAAVLLPLLTACAADSLDGRRPRAVPPGHGGPFQVWWNDSQVREDGHYLDGQRHGHVKTYYPDGTIATEGDYLAGRPEGVLLTYDNSGQLRRSQSFADGLAHGPLEEFHAEGAPAAVQQWERGLQVGAELRWHANGALQSRGQWRAGLPHGGWEHFDEQGRPLSRQWFWVAGGVLVGTLESRLELGSGRVTAQTLESLEDGTSSGWTTFWHPNGQQAGLVESRDGERHGRDVAWDDQGRPVSEGRRDRDHKVGLWRTYDPPGVLVSEVDHGEAPPFIPRDPHAGL